MGPRTQIRLGARTHEPVTTIAARGERRALTVDHLPCRASMRRPVAGAKDVAVLALLRALHLDPDFGSSRPRHYQGEVDPTQPVNRSPLTGGLPTDKGASSWTGRSLSRPS